MDDKTQIYQKLLKYTGLSLQKVLVVVFLVSIVMYDVIVLKTSSDVRLVVILSLYIGTAYVNNFTSRVTFAISLTILAVMYLLYIFTGASPMTERAGSLLFFFMLIGVIQLLKE